MFSPHIEDNKADDIDDLLSKGGIKGFRVFSNKQKDLVNNVNQNVDLFINDYNKFFFDNFFSKSFDQIEKIMDDNNDKKNTIINTYIEQTEEMDKLLGTGKILFI